MLNGRRAGPTLGVASTAWSFALILERHLSQSDVYSGRSTPVMAPEPIQHSTFNIQQLPFEPPSDASATRPTGDLEPARREFHHPARFRTRPCADAGTQDGIAHRARDQCRTSLG